MPDEESWRRRGFSVTTSLRIENAGAVAETQAIPRADVGQYFDVTSWFGRSTRAWRIERDLSRDGHVQASK
jgi:hypothetical protein